MRRFSLFIRANGIFYVRFINPETGKRSTAKSTGKTDRDEAAYVAMKWLHEGIPEGRKAIPRNPIDFFAADAAIKQLNTTTFTDDDIPKILKVLKNRGYIENASLKTENRETFIQFLLYFWNWDNSPYVEDRLAHGKGITHLHCQNNTGNVHNYFLPYFGNKLLTELTRQDMKDFSIWLTKQNRTIKVKGESRDLPGLIAPSTRNNVLKTGTVALKWATMEKRISENPAEGISYFSGKSKKRGILSDEEVKMLFNKGVWGGSPSNRLGNYTAMQTGLRQGEICALRVRDILSDRIRVEHSWSDTDGLKTTKTGEEREVAILPELATTLLNYAKLNPTKCGPNSFIFFHTIDPAKPHDGKLMTRSLIKALKSIGIDKEERAARNINFHSWRHYYASKMVDVLGQRAADLTGHATPEMLAHYADHATAADFEKAKEATAAVFGKIVPFSQEVAQ